ncbi:hypothetical protein [Pasteuria penetrans]|uniref:hypothetical protein n=1 Tax=Pasteuria penetrans TaxID=86005 RepID=UPI000FA82C2F|nr:hypothetical protein [Pasteuria penetrans]
MVDNSRDKMVELAGLIDGNLRVSKKIAYGVQMKIKEDAPDDMKGSVKEAWGDLSTRILSYDLHKGGVKVGDIVKIPPMKGAREAGQESRRSRGIDPAQQGSSTDSSEERPFIALAEILQENGQKRLYFFREDGGFEFTEGDQNGEGIIRAKRNIIGDAIEDVWDFFTDDITCSDVCGYLLNFLCDGSGFAFLKVIPRCTRFCWATWGLAVPAAICYTACATIHFAVCWRLSKTTCTHGCWRAGYSR